MTIEIVESIKNIIRLKSFQGKNQATLAYLRKRGFFMPNIRKGLMVLNGITLTDVTDGKVSKAAASNTIQGHRRNEAVMNRLAERLGVGVDLLFPDGGE